MNQEIFEPLTFHPRPLTKTFTEKNKLTFPIFFLKNFNFFLFSFNTNYGEN